MGKIEWRRSLGQSAEIIITTDSNNTQTLTSHRVVHYLLTDHLGSTDVITDFSGSVTQTMAFDPWGARRNTTNWTRLDIEQFISQGSLWTSLNSRTNQGYTGHEMLDEVGIIHMTKMSEHF